MQKKIIIFLGFLITSIISTVVYLYLNYDPSNESIGDYNEIVIAISSSDIGEANNLADSISNINNYFNKLFGSEIKTPNFEKKYNFKFKIVNNINDFNSIKKHSNLILISIDEPIDSTADNIFNEFERLHNIGRVSAFKNLYADEQLFFILNDKNDISLISNISENYSEWILSLIDSSIESTLLNQISGHDSLEDMILNKFNFNIKLRSDYQILEFDNDENFLWLGRGYPDNLIQWITIYRTKEILPENQINHLSYHLSQLSINNRRFISQYNEDSLSNFYDEINFSMPYISQKNRVANNSFFYNGMYSYKYSQNVLYDEFFYDDNNNNLRDSTEAYIDINANDIYDKRGSKISSNQTGGPFISYVFKNKEDEYIYITGYVNYPNGKKYRYIKEFESQFNNINRGN